MLQNKDKGGKNMAKCSKCKKDVSYFSKMEHKGKIYCNPCYNKMIKQENIKKKKEKDISHAKKSILKEYNFD